MAAGKFRRCELQSLHIRDCGCTCSDMQIRLKTSRQLREILDQLEIEYPYDASKAELQRIT
eukprot:6174307-Pleurochrysis_carterae.AAC.2